MHPKILDFPVTLALFKKLFLLVKCFGGCFFFHILKCLTSWSQHINGNCGFCVFCIQHFCPQEVQEHQTFLCQWDKMLSTRGPSMEQYTGHIPTPHHKVLNVEYNALSILAALIPSSADPWGPLQPALRVPGPAVDEHTNCSHRFCPVD